MIKPLVLALSILAPTLVHAAPPAGSAAAAAGWSGELPWNRLEAAPAGTWIEYVLLQGDKATGPYLRLTSIGPARAGGLWLEIWISQRPGSATQAFRLRIEGGQVKAAWARILGGKAQELPLDPAGATELPTAAGASLEAGETAPIQTAAGTFRASAAEVRTQAGRLARSWISTAVPLLGLVRLERADGTTLELHGLGKGGRGVVDVEEPAAAAK